MKFLNSLVVLLTLCVLCAVAGPSNHVSEDTLKELSVRGEKLVEEEMRRALFGVKQMREVMWRNQLKHQHLMESLRRSGDKKKGAAQLAKEVEEKLKEAEEQCKVSLQSEWERCRPCLEDACKSFYTATCRRGFATFQAKVEKFFQKFSRRFASNEPPTDGRDTLTRTTDSSDIEIVHIEETFHSWMDQVSSVVNRSVAVVSGMRSRLDDALQKAFLNYTVALTEPEESTTDPFYPARDSGFLEGVGLDEVLSSFFDFGKSVMEEFGAVVTQVFDVTQEAAGEAKNRVSQSVPRFLQNQRLCRDLRRQSSECWQLQDQCQLCQGALLSECPGVRELHMELDQVSQLVLVSREQYDEILSIVKLHADETVNWLRDMAAEFGWVAPAESGALEKIFQITKMAPDSHDELNLSSTETKVEVNILNSVPIVLSVPGDLQLQDQAFIQYVAQEALDKYKGMVRLEDQ